MPKNNKPSKIRKKINELYEENEYLSIKQNINRARSISVGTAFGGVCEVTLRSDVATVYAQIQPVEVVELIEQLAAGIGIEIAMRPKQNFASWRGWEEVIHQRVEFDKIAWKGAAVWQLNGDEIEENYKNNTNFLEPQKNNLKQLESEINTKEPQNKKSSPRKQKTLKEKENENE